MDGLCDSESAPAGMHLLFWDLTIETYIRDGNISIYILAAVLGGFLSFFTVLYVKYTVSI